MFVTHPYHNPAHSKEQWYHCFVDSLSPKYKAQNTEIIGTIVLQHLGWIINFEKSELIPTQEFDFIGMHFRAQDFTVVPLPKMPSSTIGLWQIWCQLDVRQCYSTVIHRAGRQDQIIQTNTIDFSSFAIAKALWLCRSICRDEANTQADSLSWPRQTLPTEWLIHPDLLLLVFNCWGHPENDLFATFSNKKCHQFISPFPDPRVAYIEALSIP